MFNSGLMQKAAGFWRQSSILGLMLGLALQPAQSFANMAKGYWTYIISDLGDLGGSTSRANAINYSGQVVGWATTANGNSHANGDQHAFLSYGRIMSDLNNVAPPPASSGWILQQANGINNVHQIVGYGVHNGQGPRAYLLTPVWHSSGK